MPLLNHISGLVTKETNILIGQAFDYNHDGLADSRSEIR